MSRRWRVRVCVDDYVASQIVTFEVEASALDKPTDRRRWNGPMASKEASDALHRAVEAFQASLRADGFDVAHTGYGVRAKERSPDA